MCGLGGYIERCGLCVLRVPRGHQGPGEAPQRPEWRLSRGFRPQSLHREEEASLGRGAHRRGLAGEPRLLRAVLS